MSTSLLDIHSKYPQTTYFAALLFQTLQLFSTFALLINAVAEYMIIQAQEEVRVEQIALSYQ